MVASTYSALSSFEFFLLLNEYDLLSEPSAIKLLKENRYAQITDLMRLEIIYNEGGFYFDIPVDDKKIIFNLSGYVSDTINAVLYKKDKGVSEE